MRTLLTATALLFLSSAAQAHFIWLVPQQDGETTTIQVYFGEDAYPDDPELLDRLKGLSVQQVSPGQQPQVIELQRSADTLSGTAHSETAEGSLFIGAHDLGVFERGDTVFRLKYYAKTGPELGHDAWLTADCSKLLRLDVVPTPGEDAIDVVVRFDGSPVAGAEVHASAAETDDFTGVTNDEGRVSIPLPKGGLYSIRARHIEEEAGELDGKKYPATRHYTTVAVRAPAPRSPVTYVPLGTIPEEVTSFGAAVSNGHLYTYGGHTGSAHSYSLAEQGHTLRRMTLAGGGWESVAEGPPLQGLALVAHGGKLIRIGGFTAKNAEGEEHDLWSQESVARFDPQTGQWTDLPALPEPRSSFDAAVLGDAVYVIGGWSMQGEADHDWHKTAWKLDLSQDRPEWTALPAPPFQRRALAVAAHQGKLYAIGGMQPEGGPTRRVDVFDPATGEWTQGPDLLGDEGITGFGASAFATGGYLYVSTIKGTLQRLSDDGSAWQMVGETPTARFFHRMLPVDDRHLLVVGGANMGIGKFDEVEVLEVSH